MKHIFLALLLIFSHFYCYADAIKNKATKKDIAKSISKEIPEKISAVDHDIIKEAKIAVVDVAEVLAKSSAIHSINKQFEEITSKMKELMIQKESELQSIEKELIKEKETLKEEEFEAKVHVFNKQIADLQELGRQNKSKLELVHSDAFNQVHEEMLKVLDKLSDKYNFYVALPTSQILFAKDYLDITDEVLELLNKNIKSVKITLDNKVK